MRYLFFTYYIIFSAFSSNAYGMAREGFEEESFLQKNHFLNMFRANTLQTLSGLQEGTILSQTTIRKMQKIEQEIYMPEGYGMVSKKSTKEILDQDTPSLNVLYAYTTETLAIIERIQDNTRKLCTPEASARMSPESQAEQLTLLQLFLNVESKELSMLIKSVEEIRSGIARHAEQIKKKQGSGCKTELENYRKLANLFIGNHLKIEDPQPLKPGFLDDYKLIDEQKRIDRRLVDNLFSKTKELLEHFPDHDLLFKLSLLFSYSDHPDRDEKALGLSARAICSEFQKNMMYNYKTIKLYTKLLTTYPNEKATRCKTARSLIELILKPKEEIQLTQKKGIEKTNALQTKNFFLNHCESLFSVLNGPNKSLQNEYADALYHSINFLIDRSNYSREYFMDELSTKLYNTYGSEKLPAFIKSHYAHALARKERYSEAIGVCKSLLIELKGSNCAALISNTYFSIGNMYTLICDYPQALQFFECGFASMDMSDDPSMDDQFFYSFVTLKCEPSNEEALKIMKNIAELPTREKIKEGLNPCLVDSFYQYVLERGGKSDELTELLLKKQEKILAKRLGKEKKQANAIKAALAEDKKQEQLGQNNTPSQKPRTINTTAPSSTITLPAPLFSDTPSQKEKYVAPEIKEKKKTRGVATLQIIEEKPQESGQPLIYIETLTTNKNARETFNKLFMFTHKKDCFDNEVKISLHEINSFFYALNQKVDPSQGKGSHTKVTLNLQAAGSAMEEQMIILTNSTYLEEYQIKQIREKFVKASVVPNDARVISRLKADGWLD